MQQAQEGIDLDLQRRLMIDRLLAAGLEQKTFEHLGKTGNTVRFTAGTVIHFTISGAGFYFRRQLIMRFFCGSYQRKGRKIYTPCRVLTACDAEINWPVFQLRSLPVMIERDISLYETRMRN